MLLNSNGKIQCDHFIPYREGTERCQKNKDHMGNHSWEGYVGNFELIAMSITWENKKDKH